LLLELRTAVSFSNSKNTCRMSVFPSKFLRLNDRFSLHFA